MNLHCLAVDAAFSIGHRALGTRLGTSGRRCRGSFRAVQVGGQVLEQTATHRGLQTGKPGHFGGALAEPSAELVHDSGVGRRGQDGVLALDRFQVADSHLQNVGLLQFRVPRRLEHK